MRERKHQADLRALGAFIRERRRALGLTQSQLGDRVGWVQERISLLEHGKYGTPSLPLLAGLAEALEVEQAELLASAGYLSLVTAPRPAGQPETETVATTGAPPGSEKLSAGDISHRSVELATQVERLHAGLAAAESQMHKVESLSARLASQRQQLCKLTEDLQEALAPRAG